MRTQEKLLSAGQSVRLSINGYFFALMSAQDPIDLEFHLEGKSGSNDVSKGIEAGYKEQFEERLIAVTVTSATAQRIKIASSTGVVGFDRVVTETTVQQGSVVNDFDPVVVGVASGVVIEAGARKRLIFTATKTNAGLVCLGGVGVGVNNSAIVLAAGDSWVETVAANAAFYAVATLAGQGLRISGA